MILSSVYLFSRDQIKKACDLLENFFGSNYFMQGTELLKDSDPAGPDMGRRQDTGRVSRLILSWYRAREDLAYADLYGFFRPGSHSALIGLLGRCLGDLSNIPGIGPEAGGLLEDSTFDRTLLSLSAAAGLKRSFEVVSYTAGLDGCFFAGGHYLAACLRSGSGSGNFRGLFDPLYRLRENISKINPGYRILIFYIDISGVSQTVEEAGNLFSESLAEDFFTGGSPETAAVVLSKFQFSQGSGGVSLAASGFPVINKKTSLPLPAGGQVFRPV